MTRKHSNNRMQKKPKDFEKNMATKKHYRKAEWIKNMTKIRRARRRPESGNTHRFTQNDTEKIKLENAGL